jgi:hypothetical protein
MVEYKEIYIEDKLCEIRKKLDRRGIKLDDTEKVNQTNEIMRKLLSGIYDEESKKEDILVMLDLISKRYKFIKKGVNNVLILYYFAIYNDTVDLLRNLLKNDYNFIDYYGTINLFPLDKNISSRFSEEKYIELVKTYNYIFENFSNSLENGTDNNKVLDTFAYIMSEKTDTIKTEVEDEVYENLLTAGILELFDYHYLTTASHEERRIINSVATVYPKFNTTFHSGLIPSFSYESCDSMSKEEIKKTNFSTFKTLVDRLIEIKKINPDFTYLLGFIDIHIFNSLTNEEIASLSNVAVADIVEYNYTVKLSNISEEEYVRHIRTIYKVDKAKQKVLKLIPFSNK